MITKEYLFTYEYAGRRWAFSIEATDREDAMRRLKVLPNAEYDGELYSTIDASDADEKAARRKPKLLN